jgi:hypothetical protein
MRAKTSPVRKFCEHSFFINGKYGEFAYCLSTEINGIVQHKQINPKVSSCLTVAKLEIRQRNITHLGEVLAWYAEFLLKIDLQILLITAGAILNLKIALIFLHVDPAGVQLPLLAIICCILRLFRKALGQKSSKFMLTQCVYPECQVIKYVYFLAMNLVTLKCHFFINYKVFFTILDWDLLKFLPEFNFISICTTFIWQLLWLRFPVILLLSILPLNE